MTVIIPTKNRKELLIEVLDRLLSQAYKLEEKVEIIVIDDGSTNDVRTTLEENLLLHCEKGAVHYFYQDAKGPAAARNLGVKKATGEIVLFIGDDILPLEGFLKQHLLAHFDEHPEENIAILGLADIAPEFCDSPFTDWWRRWNFRYHRLLNDGLEPDFSFFFTNNLSLKRSFLLKNGLFDESFQYAAYEDTELSVRLVAKGLKIIFKPEAEAEHYHKIDLQNACKRMITRGRAYDLYRDKTKRLGISRLWTLLGNGPWMAPLLIRALYHFADWLQTRGIISWVYIIVLMYGFQVGRGRKPLIPEIS
ncbi:MAG: glycosyltransferase [Anaerolineae bacterium]|nr:glycosyltransferase [Anaerolineae bacterium]